MPVDVTDGTIPANNIRYIYLHPGQTEPSEEGTPENYTTDHKPPVPPPDTDNPHLAKVMHKPIFTENDDGDMARLRVDEGQYIWVTSAPAGREKEVNATAHGIQGTKGVPPRPEPKPKSTGKKMLSKVSGSLGARGRQQIGPSGPAPQETLVAEQLAAAGGRGPPPDIPLSAFAERRGREIRERRERAAKGSSGGGKRKRKRKSSKKRKTHKKRKSLRSKKRKSRSKKRKSRRR